MGVLVKFEPFFDNCDYSTPYTVLGYWHNLKHFTVHV